MGSSPTEFPGQPEPPVRLTTSAEAAAVKKADTTSTDTPFPPQPLVVPVPAKRERRWPYVLLFVLTFASTTLVGEMHYLSFYLGFGGGSNPFPWWESLILGLWYSVPVLAILGCHEMGHYLACRYYRIAASRPYFLPMPIIPTGTLGAFIRIRQPIPGKRELFDIGIAGPIAGFLVAVPLLFIGMYLSRIDQIPSGEGDLIWLGEPLLFKLATWLTFGTVADGSTVTMHPVAFASWFGLLATAINLFPIGQLDGGHISYAVLGRKSSAVTLLMVACLVGLAIFSWSSWAVWAGVTIAMLFAFGPHHPRTPDEYAPLDPARKALAVFAVIMFILCFTPVVVQRL